MIRAIAIVGANLAGARAAETLRHLGFDGRIDLVGEEPWLPYERPPLSKELLWDQGRLPSNFFLRDEHWYAENRIDLRLGVRAEELTCRTGEVRLSNKEIVRADRILLTTGGSARRLPFDGADARNVHHLRTKDDADRLSVDLQPGSHIVVIGMGVIGSEVAASARKLGCEVTAIDPAPAPMTRVLGQRFGSWLGGVHRSKGVNVRCSTGVSRLVGRADGMIRAVECEDGSRISCDAVVVGIGILPKTELAKGAGLTLGNGISVDRQCMTSHPNVFAAGDVADQPGFFGGRIRMETYQNAADQGAAAAHAMIGRGVDYLRPCWFWSDQYEYNIQVTGKVEDGFHNVFRSDDAEGFSVFFKDGDVIVGMLTVNRPMDMAIGKRLVERRSVATDDQLRDSSMPLRKLLKGAPA